jgi:uncharacterized protein YebE (UPF0316 family)
MTWVLIAIFLLKTLELGIESMRVLLMVNGHPLVSSVLATIDVVLALVALKFIVENLTKWQVYLSYALGYGTGIYLGSLVYSSMCGG